MQAITFYLAYPFIYLISLSPFRLLYWFSDGLFYVLYYLVGYRKKTVIKNLKNSFPEKSPKEIKKIVKEYYRYLSDLILESVKTLSITEKEVRKHTKMLNVGLLDQYYEEGKSVILVMGHFGNWELAGPCFSLNCRHTLSVVYRPLINPYFEKIFAKSRTKFETEIIPVNNTLRGMIGNKKRVTATAFIADQAPANMNGALWMDFLNQDTPVFNGPEKISKMLGYPVIYVNIIRVKRGLYEIIPTLLSENPKSTEENEITIKSNRFLESEINKQPEIWLWSHKRWKRQRIQN
jgi:KDO2-lipid IV(A) lauroyltransferase